MADRGKCCHPCLSFKVLFIHAAVMRPIIHMVSAFEFLGRFPKPALTVTSHRHTAYFDSPVLLARL